MGILLAFAPFIAFAVVDRLFGATEGLIAGAVVSIVLILRDFISEHRAPKILEVGSVVLFGGITLYTLMTGADWPVLGVRLSVDIGLLLIVLISMAIRRPFTLQYAREQVPEALWHEPRFLRTNYVITGVWALAFLVMVAADLLMLLVPGVPMKVGIFATIAALLGAIKFTSWYPDQQRKSTAA